MHSLQQSVSVTGSGIRNPYDVPVDRCFVHEQTRCQIDKQFSRVGECLFNLGWYGVRRCWLFEKLADGSKERIAALMIEHLVERRIFNSARSLSIAATIGRRESASAFWFARPGRCSIVKSNSCRSNAHRARRLGRSEVDINQRMFAWSVCTTKGGPQRYFRNSLQPYTTASNSFSRVS